MTEIEIPRPTSGDVVELILEDHRLFETLLRELRDATADRAAARQALAEVLIAHGEAEESEVYPQLRKKRAIGAHEAEHGEEEHAEGNEALLALLECKGTDTQKFDDAVEELAEALNHHIGEEEQTILNPARTDVSEQVRADLGVAWATRRNQLLEEGCGSVENVRRIVRQAHKEGLLDDEDDDGEE
ncbi:MAG TPA: hemerythrin domain-containing protein [Pedococcus sp.]|jgi:hemerythrin superfamily protein